jgi:hypothetical protein
MQEITVKLWRNHRQDDWSVEINGKRYEFEPLTDDGLGSDETLLVAISGQGSRQPMESKTVLTCCSTPFVDL